MDTKSGVVKSCQIPGTSDYVHGSMKVHLDYRHRIGDHCLVTCQINMRTQPPPAIKLLNHDSNLGEPLNITKWDRRDGGNSEYWKPMQTQLELQLGLWEKAVEKKTIGSVDNLLCNFTSAINLALTKSLKVRKKRPRTLTGSLSIHPDIFRCRWLEKTAYHNYLNASTHNKLILKKKLKESKKALRSAIRKAAYIKKRELVQSIESLRSRDPMEYWKRLYQLDDSETTDQNTLPAFVKNSLGTLVSGLEMCEIWAESFRKLGLETSDFDDFDTHFYHQINDLVDQHEKTSTSFYQEALDKPISLDEVNQWRSSRCISLETI